MITLKIIQVQHASCLGQHDNFLDGAKLLEETMVLRAVFVTSKIIQGKWTLLRLDFTCHKHQLEGQ